VVTASTYQGEKFICHAHEYRPSGTAAEVRNVMLPSLGGLIRERRGSMHKIQFGDQVVSMAPNGETVEVYTVVKVLADGVQVDGASGKLSKAELRAYTEDTVKQIQEKEGQLKAIKREIRSLYNRLDEVN